MCSRANLTWRSGCARKKSWPGSRSSTCELADGKPLFDFGRAELFSNGELDQRGTQAHRVEAELHTFSGIFEMMAKSDGMSPARCDSWRPGCVCPVCELGVVTQEASP